MHGQFHYPKVGIASWKIFQIPEHLIRMSQKSVPKPIISEESLAYALTEIWIGYMSQLIRVL